MIRLFALLVALGILISFSGCQDEEETALLSFKYHFDPDQVRLNNFGLPASLPSGNAALDPELRSMSVHYIELMESPLTQYGEGEVVYLGPETNEGGDKAIDFREATLGAEGETFYNINLKDVKPGTYPYIRVSVGYQNGDILFNLKNIPIIGQLNQQKGTIASFLGYNTYIKNFTVRETSLSVNDDMLQGFWGFETGFDPPYDVYNTAFSGQAPAGATTVVNPLAASSPIPAGSCVITGQFDEPLIINGDEAGIDITLSFSINDSFEWVDANGNGEWDVYADAPENTEEIVDMGLRGLIPSAVIR